MIDYLHKLGTVNVEDSEERGRSSLARIGHLLNFTTGKRFDSAIFRTVKPNHDTPPFEIAHLRHLLGMRDSLGAFEKRALPCIMAACCCNGQLPTLAKIAQSRCAPPFCFGLHEFAVGLDEGVRQFAAVVFDVLVK